MQNILSKNQDSVLKGLAQDTLFAFDFDGTLTGIVSTPGQVKMRSKTLKLLNHLCETQFVVAISGRGAADLAKNLRLSKIKLFIGNHGSDWLIHPGNGLTRIRPSQRLKPQNLKPQILKARIPRPDRAAMKKRTRAWIKVLQPELDLLPGVFLEDKMLSLSLHFRNSPKSEPTRKALLGLAQKLNGCHLIGGKCVLNLLPKEAWHKGDALKRLLKLTKFKKAFFIGDDVTDEDGFRAKLKQEFISVRVGKSMQSAAKFYVPDQMSVDELLKKLVAL